jgi:hypothetical protein
MLSINSIKQTVSQRTDQEWRNKFLHTKYSGSASLRLQGVSGTQLQPNPSGGPWIKLAGSNNTVFACMCRCILNHAPIGSYYTRFNINSPVQCPCGCFQDREHILARCPQLVRSTPCTPHFVIGLMCFLKANPSAFAFSKPEQGIG